MSEKRFTIKPQDDYWAVVDNYNDDKVCIINGIHTKIEAIWLCDFMNEQQDQIIYWKHKVSSLLWILSQFDKEKVKELLKEVEDE